MKKNDKDIIRVERMDYAKYKNEYKWNQTVDFSYDSKTKTIEVVMACATNYADDEI